MQLYEQVTSSRESYLAFLSGLPIYPASYIEPTSSFFPEKYPLSDDVGGFDVHD